MYVYQRWYHWSSNAVENYRMYLQIVLRAKWVLSHIPSRINILLFYFFRSVFATLFSYKMWYCFHIFVVKFYYKSILVKYLNLISLKPCNERFKVTRNRGRIVPSERRFYWYCWRLQKLQIDIIGLPLPCNSAAVFRQFSWVSFNFPNLAFIV